MTVAVRHRIMSIEDFLAWEARQEFKFEFDGFEPVGMVGGTEAHAAIQRNLAIAFGTRLRGKPCQFYGSDLKVVTGTRVRYPDGQIVCSASDGAATFMTTPTVLFEVTSPSSEAVDHGAKVHEYCGIASLRRYVILEQSTMAATVWERDDTGWAARACGPADVLVFPELGFSVPLQDLYEGVTIPG